MLQVKILVNGEERISPWASYVLQPPRESQVTLYILCVRVIFYILRIFDNILCVNITFEILKGFEGTAFAQHLWSPAADAKHKLSHQRPSKPSSLR